MTTETPGLFRKDSTERKEDIKKIVEEIFSENGMKMKGVLTSNQALQLTRGFLFAERYHSALLLNLCTTLLVTSVAVRGRGRNDLIQALAAALSINTEDKDTMRRRILGG